MYQNQISIQDYFNMDVEQRCMQHNLVRLKRYDLHLILNENISEREKVAVITELNRRQLEDAPQAGYRPAAPPLNINHSLFLGFSNFLWIFSWIVFALGGISFLVFVKEAYDYYDTYETVEHGLPILLMPFFVGIFLMAISILIKLLVKLSLTNESIIERLDRR